MILDEKDIKLEDVKMVDVGGMQVVQIFDRPYIYIEIMTNLSYITWYILYRSLICMSNYGVTDPHFKIRFRI